MKCRNLPIVFTRIRSSRAKSTSTRIHSHFLCRDVTPRHRSYSAFHRTPCVDWLPVNSSHGQLVTRSSRPTVYSSPVNSSHTRLITQSTRHMVNSSHGQLVTRSSRHTVISSHSQLVTSEHRTKPPIVIICTSDK